MLSALLFLCLHIYYCRRNDCPLQRASRTDLTQILSMALHYIMVAVLRPLPYLPLPLLLRPSAAPVHSTTLLNGTVHQHLWAMVQLRTGSLLSRYLHSQSCVICAFLYFVLLYILKCCFYFTNCCHSSNEICGSISAAIATDWVTRCIQYSWNASSVMLAGEPHFIVCIFIVHSLFFDERF